MNINKENSKLFTLYPKDNLTDEQIKPYKEKLDLALSDPKIKNLAITGPYDSGKSSLLQSYFKNREFKRGKIKTWIRKLTGKNSNMSTTYPKRSRSIKLPMVPAKIKHRLISSHC